MTVHTSQITAKVKLIKLSDRLSSSSYNLFTNLDFWTWKIPRFSPKKSKILIEQGQGWAPMHENVYGKPIRGKQNMLYAKFVKAISFRFKNCKYILNTKTKRQYQKWKKNKRKLVSSVKMLYQNWKGKLKQLNRLIQKNTHFLWINVFDQKM